MVLELLFSLTACVGLVYVVRERATCVTLLMKTHAHRLRPIPRTVEMTRFLGEIPYTLMLRNTSINTGKIRGCCCKLISTASPVYLEHMYIKNDLIVHFLPT